MSRHRACIVRTPIGDRHGVGAADGDFFESLDGGTIDAMDDT